MATAPYLVYNRPDAVILLSQTRPSSTLFIRKPDGEIKEVNKSAQQLDGECGSRDQKFSADGLLGVIRLLGGPYVILITGKSHVGALPGHHDVWKVTSSAILPLSSSSLSARQKADEDIYVSMLTRLLQENFYFSYTGDITQTLPKKVKENDKEPLWKRVDSRFFWNQYLSKPLIDLQLNDWILPVMMGFIRIESCQINQQKFDFILISRRNVNRAGTRYTRRGADSKGDVANNVETEQLIANESNIASFVQTRGSVPVFWRQNPTLKYNPPIRVSANQQALQQALSTHAKVQTDKYGRQVWVSLVDQKGREVNLHQSYVNNAALFNQSHPDAAISFVPFDFHHECKGMKYQNLGKLISQIQSTVDSFGWNEGKDKVQNGVVRTNCVDNLDRTNVVQSLIGQHVLNNQLRKWNVLSSSETIADHSTFFFLFKNIWADNADAISVQYSGTGALKNDFTRTGKRNTQGLINDGINSVTRYFLNNFNDGFRQDCYDLFLGNYRVDGQSASPFIKREIQRNYLNFGVISLGTIVVLLSALSPSEMSWMGLVMYLLVWGGGLYAAYQVSLKLGDKLVDRPVLCEDPLP